MLTTSSKELIHGFTSTLVQHIYITHNSTQNKIMTVHFNVKSALEN